MSSLLVGTALRQAVRPGMDPVADARHVESLGFDFLSVTDHLVGRPAYETWTHLTWAAVATERVGLLTDVLGLPYRHPALLAKMAEALQRLSGGRLLLGVGGGGSDREFHALGLAVRRPAEKVDALRESIEVMRSLWTAPAATYDGAYFALRDAELEPKPEPPIPVWVGSYGTRALGVTGRLGDGWLPSLPYLPPERYAERRDVVRRAAAKAGRDPDAIVCGYNVLVAVGEGVTARPNSIAGPPGLVVEHLAALRGLGVTALNLWPAVDPEDQRERLAAEVLPGLRAAWREA